MNKQVIVVGGGVGGLAAAALLGHQGYRVTVLEQNQFLGGRMRVFHRDEFVLDAGPSWYLMPEVFEHFFSLFGKRSTDYYQLEKLDPSYRVFFDDGRTFDITGDARHNEEVFDQLEPGGGAKLRTYLDMAAYKYEIAMRDFVYTDYRNVFQFFNRRLMTEGLRLNVFQNLHRYVQRSFSSEAAQQILEYPMVFLGTSPFNTPALYSMMSHADITTGVFYPRGGFSAITDGLVQLGSEFGVTYRTETPVTRVGTRDGRVIGVETADGETIGADIVVMNADYRHAELDLLSKADRSYGASYWQRRTLAPAMFKFCFALNRRLTGLVHHNLYFPRDWHEHFDRIFTDPGWPERPAFYLGHPSRTDRTIVPEDGDILFFLVPVAPGLDDAPERRQEFRAQVLEQFRVLTGETIQDRDIAFEQICTVSDCARYFNAPLGSALGLSHTLFQTAVFRPHIRSRRVRGLYYAGQMTQPGVGLPMVMISGEIAAGAVVEDRRSA